MKSTAKRFRSWEPELGVRFPATGLDDVATLYRRSAVLVHRPRWHPHDELRPESRRVLKLFNSASERFALSDCLLEVGLRAVAVALREREADLALYAHIDVHAVWRPVLPSEM